MACYKKTHHNTKLFSNVLLIMASLLALIIPGYILRKLKLFTDGAVAGMVSILLYICQPLLSITPFLDQDSPSANIVILMGLCFLISFFGHIAVFALAKLIFFKWKNIESASAYTFASVFTNCGFLDLPFIKMLTNSSEAMLFAIMYNISFNILMWTLGIYILTKDKKAISFKKAFINPAIVPLVISFPLFFFPSINIISGTPIENSINLLANMSAPISMIVVGIRLADIGLLNAIKGIGNYIGSFVRLIIAPALMIGLAILLRLIPYFSNSSLGLLCLAVPVILMGMPPASLLVTFAEKTGRARVDSTRIFITATLLSVISVPLLIMTIKAIGLV